MIPLVIGGTGTVGSQSVRKLVEGGINVRVMTRDTGRFAALPKGAVGVVGDLENPTSLREAFKGADSLFLITPLSPTETLQGIAAVEAAKSAGIRRIVYMSVYLPKGSEHIPHFKSKIPVEEAVQQSRLEWTILRPNNFFQNDHWFQEAITKYGVYPQPIGSKGMHRVDVRDIADAAVNALTQPGHHAQIYPLNGFDLLTGADVARIWGRHLGREVRYAGDDLDAWAAQARNALPEWMVNDFRIMYQYFQQSGFRATEADFTQQRKGVGHEPRSFEAFVSEIAPRWKGSVATHA